MHIRLATPNDLSSMASISVSCFWTDELYQYTNPWRDQYPNHFQDLFFRRFRLRYITPGWVFHVAVTDEGNPGHEDKGKVVGYSAWERRGTSEAAKKWQKDTYWKSECGFSPPVPPKHHESSFYFFISKLNYCKP